jgi:hypothetical protein
LQDRRNPESPLLGTIFRVGQVVPASGIYQVQHSQHRLPHEVTLVGAVHFPPCSACKYEVTFTFCRSVQLEGFSFALNSIPPLREPDDDGQEPALPITAVS